MTGLASIPTLSLRFGTTVYTVSLEAFAKAFSLSLPEVLSKLQTCFGVAEFSSAKCSVPVPTHESTNRLIERNVNGRKEIYNPETLEGMKGSRGRKGVWPVDNPDDLAEYLATRLEDMHSLPFYQLLVRRVSRTILETKLSQALAIPAHKLRRSRAAYFTHLVKPYLRRPNRSRLKLALNPYV